MTEELPYERTFVENVTRARKAGRMTQTELAKRVARLGLPFHQPTIQRIEAGLRPVRLNEAVALCEVLALDLPEALHPQTAETANRELVAATRQARLDWSQIVERLANERNALSALIEEVSAERSFYVRAYQAMAAEPDPDVEQRAWDLINGIGAMRDAITRALDQVATDLWDRLPEAN